MSDTVGVYYANARLSAAPAYRVDYGCAREWVESALARWVNRAKAVQLLQTKPSMHRPAQSLVMGPHVTQKAAEGSPYFLALVAGWGPAHASR